MDFSTRLKELRENNEMKQKDLAKILKITRQAVSNYEQGTRFPKDEKLLIKLADLFDVSLDYLLGRINTEKMNTSIDLIDKIVIEHINERKESYYTDRTMALRRLLTSVNDFPYETIDTISQVIEMLKNSLDK